MFRLTTPLMLAGGLALASGCSEPAAVRAEESADGTDGQPSPEVSSSSGASTGLDVNDTSSSSSSSGGLGDTDTDTDADGALPVCDRADFDSTRALTITEPFCTLWERCTSEATCVLTSSTPPEEDDAAWHYTLSCDGVWLHGFELDRVEAREGVEVEVSSLRELAWGTEPLDYVASSNYWDKLSYEHEINELSVGGELVAIDMVTGRDASFAGLSSMTLEAQCDPDGYIQSNFECVSQVGLVGTDPDGGEISIVNRKVVLEPWFMSVRGWKQCSLDRSHVYEASLQVSAVHEDILAGPLR